MLLIGTDSNHSEITQTLLKITQITTSCHIHRGGGRGNLNAISVHMTFYMLLKKKNLLPGSNPL